jgi:Putative MetA-pathway of phenol degradation
MLKRIIHIAILGSIGTITLSAQEMDPIQTGRPDQSETPYMTPTKYLQIETGVIKENASSKVYTLTVPTFLIKYGLSDRFELRVGTDFLKQPDDLAPKYAAVPLTFGFKTTLFEEKGLCPKTSFLGQITSASLGNKAYRTSYIAPTFAFLMQHTLSQKFALTYNIGSDWNGENAAQTYFYTLSLGFNISDKLSCFGESYGFFPKDQNADHRFNLGFMYLASNDCQVDVSGGFRLNDEGPKNFISAGISYRFQALK